MSSGIVKPFVDFNTNNANDTNENNEASIQPIADGESVNATVAKRPPENLRQRTEAIRGRQVDSLFLENADRVLVIAGPGKVTWPGSTTASASGIPVISDVLYILPMLTPGFAQAAPVPPVASVFGTLHLKRASDNMDSILVTSQRRSYAAGDQINVTVTPGAVYSCTLDTEGAGALRRTIKIVATGSTTLGTVITSLNGLIPPSPDNTQLVTAALEGGALSGDLILTSQAKQYVSGNYDGEGHAITPANLASFFSSNPTQALAEGDTLCIRYDMLFDTASNGGRRQAIPENSNTTIPAAAYFNSRVHPEYLYNALPICKVVNNELVFATGGAVPAGAVTVSIGGGDSASVTYAGGGNWADGTTNPATSVEGQLDKIITDLAGATGTAKVQGSAVGSDLSAATLAAQISALVTGWLKLNRNDTVTGQNVFNALQKLNGASNTGFAWGTDTPPNVATGRPKPIWYAVLDTAATIQLRVFAGPLVRPGVDDMQAGFMVTLNASVTGMSTTNVTYARDAAAWTDTSPAYAIRLLVNQSGVKYQWFNAAGGATWDDTNWETWFNFDFEKLTLGDTSGALGYDLDLYTTLGNIRMSGGSLNHAIGALANVAAGAVSTTGGTPGAILAVSTDAYFPCRSSVANANQFDGGVIYQSAAGSAPDQPTYQFYKASRTGALTALGSPVTSGFTGGGVLIALGLATALSAGDTIWLRVQTTAGAACTLQSYNVVFSETA